MKFALSLLAVLAFAMPSQAAVANVPAIPTAAAAVPTAAPSVWSDLIAVANQLNAYYESRFNAVHTRYVGRYAEFKRRAGERRFGRWVDAINRNDLPTARQIVRNTLG